jgi:PAS domain S-box-containing protein
VPEHPGRVITQGWPGLFASAFSKSRNAMVLVDETRRIVDVNPAFQRLVGARRSALIGRPLWELVVGGPLMTAEEWVAHLAQRHFTGEALLRCADGGSVAVQWGADTAFVTGRPMVLFVALGTSRWGRRFRRAPQDGDQRAGELTGREREIVALVALGATGREIADELHISHDTVRTHVRNAMSKLHARSRAHLVAKAMADGLVLR